MTRTTRTWRSIAACTFLALPPLLVLWSAFAWKTELPDAIGTHWSSPGGADRATPTSEFFAGTSIGSASATMIGALVISVFRKHDLTVKLTFLGAGSLAGIIAAQWLVSGWLTLRTGDPYQAILGPWILVHFAAWTYGVIPMLLTPGTLTPTRTTSGPRDDGTVRKPPRQEAARNPSSGCP